MAEQQVLDADATEVHEPEPNGNGASTAVVRRPDRTPLSQRDPVALAQHFANSGYFKDARDMSQAVVKIVAGEELGFGPMTAMSGIHIIEGKPSLSANLLATLVKKHAHYDYKPVTIDDTQAELRFLEDGEEVGRSSFTIQKAKRAGLVRDGSGWVKYPEAMLFARALSQGVRWFCPDVTAGSPAYTPEELGAQVDERGEVVAMPVESEQEPPAPQDGLDPERVSNILTGIDKVGWDGPAISVNLGAVGAESQAINRPDSIQKAIRNMTPEQADAFEVRLQEAADAAA